MVFNAFNAFADHYDQYSAGKGVREAWMALSAKEKARFRAIAKARRESNRSSSTRKPKRTSSALKRETIGKSSSCSRLRKAACGATQGCDWTVGKGCSTTSRYAIAILNKPAKKQLPVLPFGVDADGLPDEYKSGANAALFDLMYPNGQQMQDESVEKHLWRYEPWYSFSSRLADNLRNDEEFEDLLRNYFRDAREDALSDADARRYVAFINIKYFAPESRQTVREMRGGRIKR